MLQIVALGLFADCYDSKVLQKGNRHVENASTNILHENNHHEIEYLRRSGQTKADDEDDDVIIMKTFNATICTKTFFTVGTYINNVASVIHRQT